MKAENRKKKLFRILDGAYWLFLEKGFEQTTMDQIAQASGVSKPTLYKYVKTKDGILLKFRELSCERIKERVQQDLKDDHPELALWRGISGIHCLALKMGRELFSHFIIQQLEFDDGSCRFDGRLEELCLEAIRVLQNSGVIQNKANAHTLYHLLSHLNQGMIMDWCKETEGYDFHAQFIQIYECVLDYQSAEDFDFPLCSAAEAGEYETKEACNPA